MENVTNCTAIDNGWVWNIPLYNRIGSGYVFSTKFISEEDALEEYKSYLDSDKMTLPNSDRSKDLKFKLIEIKNGKHKQAWKNNVIGVGLSYAFVEPLESTGLLSVQEIILALCETLYKEQISNIHKQNFNYFCDSLMENFKAFVTFHYIPSARRDTEYWKYVTNNVEMNFLEDLGVKDITRSFVFDHRMPDDNSGIPDIFAGMHMFSMNPLSYDWLKFNNKTKHENNVVNYYTQQTQTYWNQKKHRINKLADNLPSHYKYLKEKFYKETN